MDPKNFLRAPLVPIYTNFEGAARAEKIDFLVKIFQEMLKKTQKIWPKQGLLLWESSENQFGRPKKGRQFLKVRPPPLEKILDPPLSPTFF